MKSEKTPDAGGLVIFSAGSKGGVGKSIASIATIDTLLDAGVNPVLVETDTSNPDVWKIYGNELDHRLLDLDGVEGWMDLVNYADEMKGRTIVVNTAARNNESLAKFGNMLNDNLGELGRKFVTFWVINRQRDSLELLKDFLVAMPNSKTHVFRNGYFGEEHKFDLYNGSKIRATIESNGGRSYNFPDLADRVIDEIYTKRVTIARAMQDMPIGNRTELRRWRVLARDVVNDALS
jgi:hypothetical protein